jgi:hypothetical protein
MKLGRRRIHRKMKELMTGADTGLLGMERFPQDQWAWWNSHPDGDDMAGARDDRKTLVH